MKTYFLVQIVDDLWSIKSSYQSLRSRSELEDFQKSLFSSTFSFSSMYRSWIPKPPGQMRPITQPNNKDRIVMEGLSCLLNQICEDFFLSNSHGFRKGRGTITFFVDVSSWGPVDRLIKSDIVKCFDNIDHDLLIQVLQSYLGE